MPICNQNFEFHRIFFIYLGKFAFFLQFSPSFFKISAKYSLISHCTMLRVSSGGI